MTTIFGVPGSSPLNPFSAPIQAFITATDLSSTTGPSLDETATRISTIVTTSSNPVHAIWELWDAFFTAVVTYAVSHAPHLALLTAIQEQPPARPRKAPSSLSRYTQADGKLHWSTLPGYSDQWRDVHDILEAWRDWDGVRASGARLSGSGSEYYLRFCAFSAAELKRSKGRPGMVHPISVFYACRNTLESDAHPSCERTAHRISPEQVKMLDIRVAAIWMRDGGRALWEADKEELRRGWATTLDHRTDLWPKEDGLTRARWQVWGARFRAFAIRDGYLDDEIRAIVAEAAEVVNSILDEALE